MSALTLSTINFMWGRTKMKDRIKQIRNHFGLTQEKFAKRINKVSSQVLKPAEVDFHLIRYRKSVAPSVLMKLGLGTEPEKWAQIKLLLI